MYRYWHAVPAVTPTVDDRVRWQVNDPGSLMWEQWDGEYVVYHVPSGTTHFLNATGGLILHRLVEGDADARGLAEVISQETGVVVDGQLTAQVESILIRFSQLGLINQSPR